MSFLWNSFVNIILWRTSTNVDEANTEKELESKIEGEIIADVEKVLEDIKETIDDGAKVVEDIKETVADTIVVVEDIKHLIGEEISDIIIDINGDPIIEDVIEPSNC